jgi:UDP-glucose 4-epimerase
LKRVAVTGGAGFIGSHLVRRLVAEGRDVVILDDLSRGRRERIADLDGMVEICTVDLRNFDLTLAAIQGAESVYHLAARVGNVEFLHGTASAELAAIQTNLVIDANVFRACLACGVQTIVFASSVAVYPIERQRGRDAVFAEIDLGALNPDGGYGWAKLLGEIQLQWMIQARSGIARIFSVYGEGEDLDEFAHAVPALMCKAIAYPTCEFRVWGDGSQSRDYLYVADAVDALLRLERTAAWPPVVVNVGGGRAVTIRSLVEKIIAISGKPISPIYQHHALVGPVSRTANIERAKQMLDWRPAVPIEEGLVRTYRWVESRLRQI